MECINCGRILNQTALYCCEKCKEEYEKKINMFQSTTVGITKKDSN